MNLHDTRNVKIDEGRRRIGILVPSSNTIMENDLHVHLPIELYTVHTARMYLEETTPTAEKQMIEEFSAPAAAQLKTLHPHLLVFGCTSAGSLFGPDYDQKITQQLGEIAGCHSIGVLSCAIDALKNKNAKRIAILTPYIDELNRTIKASMEQAGFEVVKIHGMGIDINFELAQVQPEQIVAFATQNLVGVSADALFISCTNFRALEVKNCLECQLRLPVVTSNSAVLEAMENHFASL